ncbi:hypothetical protein EsDP_00002104 [Epichloe bromicola]|uniref:Uncharacterized protein n=1 Tax=Epichloe bromicola TaxID=79588 RepID=A0ABQ0CJU4_9HYPO
MFSRPSQPSQSKITKGKSHEKSDKKNDNSKSTKKAVKDKSPKSGKKGESSKHGKDSQVVDLYCALYPPQFGNYYHWAFAMNQNAKKRWRIFQVVQEEENGPFKRNQRQVDPRSSSTCLQPLSFLGQMHTDYWDWLIEAALLLEAGAIDDAAWSYGYNLMFPYYGQDFGGQEGHHFDEYEEEEAEEEDNGGRRILSEEFVHDSDDAE